MADLPDSPTDVPSGNDYEALDRNHYFTGQFLTARDLTRDQGFHVARHRLHQRLQHGWGVVCGLHVKLRPDAPPGCVGRSAVVEPGAALDCHGRELVVPQATYIDLATLPAEEDLANPAAEAPTNAKPADAPYLLCAAYTVEGAEEVPVLYADGRRLPTNWNCLHERVRFVRRTRLHRECWPALWVHPHDLKFPADCDQPPAGASCLDPHCACGETVPLALVLPVKDDQGNVKYEVHSHDRRSIPRPLLPQDLTHIRDTSWDHGTPLSLTDLENELDWTLRVFFDRPLHANPGIGRGANDQTFQVHMTDPEDPRYLLRLPGHVSVASDLLAAEFRITDNCRMDELARAWVHHRHRHHRHLPTLYVALKCDFIPDYRGRAVDGDFIRDDFPTGDGVPGGLFESWFDLTF